MSKDKNSDRGNHWTVHLERAAREFLDDVRDVVPEDTRTHLRNSRRELLLAARSLLDERIEDLEPDREREPRNVEVN